MTRRVIEFFEVMRQGRWALAFDDVTIPTGESKILPARVSLQTMFSRRVPLHIPITSAAMDTVTEAKMSIVIAFLGGIGVIHRHLPPEAQAEEVGLVKNDVNAIVDKPVYFRENLTLGEVKRQLHERKLKFDNFPIVDASCKPVGILTASDLKKHEDLTLLISAVMTPHRITAPEGTELEEAHRLMKEHHTDFIPVVNMSGVIVALYTASDIRRIKSAQSAMNNLDERGQLRVAAAVGVGDDALKRAELLSDKHVDAIVIDASHGDHTDVRETLRALKRRYPAIDIVAGNISESPSTQRLLDDGADGIKVGQGPGSICTTRKVTGCGCPQVTAINNAALVADKYGVPVIGDGGIRYSGDVTKAIVAGACCVMLGGALAGTDEAPGEVIHYQGRLMKVYRGMGSLSAMLEHRGSRDRYRQDDEKFVPEGIDGAVPYRGAVREVIQNLIGGLRSGMGLAGTASIGELRERGDFYRETSAGDRESHVHDVVITKDAPNYPRG